MSEWVVRLIEQSGYLGVGFLMFLETLFPPIPSEVIMPVAGMAAQQGRMSFGLAVAAGTAGAMLGNIVWYLAARALGHDRLQPFIQRHGRWLTINWRDIERAHRWFERHGFALVLLGRLIPTIRSVISIPAGLLSMRLKTFLIWSTAGTAAWTAALATAGWGLGKAFRDVEKVLGPLSTAIILLIVVAYIWRQLTWRKRHP